MSQSQSSRAGVTLMLVGAFTGLVLALYAYFAPLTGVTGSLGSLAVIVVCAALAVMALMLGAANQRSSRVVLRVLMAVALVGTFVAALLLHQWWICVAMGVFVVGMIVDFVRPAAVDRAAYP